MLDVLVAYGEKVGVAFQLADDVIDLASDGAESGKTPGTDLREGVADAAGAAAPGAAGRAPNVQPTGRARR